MTKGEARKLYLRWLDEATVNGQEARDEDLIDRFDHFLDGAVSYLASQFKLPGVMTAVCGAAPIAAQSRAIKNVCPPERFVLTAERAGAYYVEVCGAADLTVSGEKRTVPAGDGFTACRGNVPPAAGPVTLALSGRYPFTVRNAALYGCGFPTDAEVPPVGAWLAYDMPEDYREFDEIIYDDGETRRPLTEYRKEGGKTFLVPGNLRGALEFRYWRNPVLPGPQAPDDAALDVREEAARLIPLKVASDVMAATDETLSVSRYLNTVLSNMLVNLLGDQTGEKRGIRTVYGMV